MTKKMTNEEAAKFLLDSGLLFEINWKILHPFGLALNLEYNEFTGGYDFDGLKKTEDLIGWEFDEGTFSNCLHKLKRFVQSKEIRERLSVRKMNLGCVVQNESERDNTVQHTIQDGLV